VDHVPVEQGPAGRVAARGAVAGTLCPGAGCRRRSEAGQPRRLVTGRAGLCPVCRNDLAVGLSSLPGLHEECGRLLGGAAVGSGELRDRTSGGPLPGLPFNTAAADARTAILAVLGSWSSMVVEERRVGAPPRTVPALAAFLARHMDWVTARAAAELSGEIAELVRTARRVVSPDPLRRMVLGPCVEPGCPGRLTALVRPGQPHRSEVRCDAGPGHRWADHEWLRLRRRMAGEGAGTAPGGAAAGAEAGPVLGEGAGERLGDRVGGRVDGRAGEHARAEEPEPRWLSAGDIARLWHIAPGSVYRLASEQRWRRRSRSGRTAYHEADVLGTFSERETRGRERPSR
jgi:hypothetical protein